MPLAANSPPSRRTGRALARERPPPCLPRRALHRPRSSSARSRRRRGSTLRGSRGERRTSDEPVPLARGTLASRDAEGAAAARAAAAGRSRLPGAGAARTSSRSRRSRREGAPMSSAYDPEPGPGAVEPIARARLLPGRARADKDPSRPSRGRTRVPTGGGRREQFVEQATSRYGEHRRQALGQRTASRGAPQEGTGPG